MGVACHETLEAIKPVAHLAAFHSLLLADDKYVGHHYLAEPLYRLPGGVLLPTFQVATASLILELRPVFSQTQRH